MKITPGHLARGAFIYIRQSTVDQLANNHESGLRQYGLADRARALGWTDVTVIDDDLGRSGSGVSRPGFERLLAAICEGRVGAVFAIEASRLARNGRDWHTLIEFCGLVGTVIVDEDGTYETAPSKRPVVAGHEGDDERARAVAPARPFDGSSEAEGAARRALLHGSRWLCESGSRKNRNGSRPARARGDWVGLHPFCRDAKHPSGIFVASRRSDRATVHQLKKLLARERFFAQQEWRFRSATDPCLRQHARRLAFRVSESVSRYVLATLGQIRPHGLTM